ncbi:hypothetical protein J2R76_003716 [Bradyrhizobium sp. USDA 4532]|nr:hypothetical protein [Bradyrhizobium sp. USDA 4545]MCP1920125.1 hypothetical protein [Bradyrhizobium sp. USDA 4532]
MAVKKELQDAGVEPVFNPKTIGAAFYRRALICCSPGIGTPIAAERDSLLHIT